VGKKLAEDPHGQAWALFLASHAKLVDWVEAELARNGLPPLTWYDLLWELEKAENGRLRMSELAQAVVLSRSNLTRLADRLVEAGLIVREAVPGDRRGAYCVLTPEGRETRRRVWPVYRDAIERLFSRHLSEREAALLNEVFGRLLRGGEGAPGRDADAPQSRTRRNKAKNAA